MQAIIGMSPGNSYFKDKEVAHLLKEAIKRYGKVAIMVADVPAVATYQAMWYTLSKARWKAILKWNNLKNRTKRVLSEMGFEEDSITIIDWDSEVEQNIYYQEYLLQVQALYNKSMDFQNAVNDTSLWVLQNSGKEFTEEAVKQAVHYLLSEIAFLEFAPKFFLTDKTCYLYHKNWDVFEYYIAGKYDGKIKPYMGFILLEAPYETYLSYWDSQKSRRDLIQERWTLACAFIPYFEYFTVSETGDHSGVFYDIMKKVGEKYNINIDFSEQVWYGSISWRLNTWFVDVFACPTWASQKRRLEMFFSKPLFQSPVYGYINTTSSFSWQSVEELQNNSLLRIAVKENDIHHELAEKYFPNAILVRVPQLSRIEEVIQFVLDGKADMTFRDPILVEKYLDSKNIDHTSLKKTWLQDQPFATYDNCIALPWWEFELKRVIDEYVDIYLENTKNNS
jgi:tRNA-dependent cyclodipeptide synthase